MSIKSSLLNLADVTEQLGVSDEMQSGITDALKDLGDAAEYGRDLILKRMDEKEFVRLLMVQQGLLVAFSASEGQIGIFAADKEGSLQGYTHSIILSTIAMLIEEGVL